MSNSSAWLVWGFAFIAVWGLAWMIVSILNPKNILDGIYRLGRKYNRLGPIRFGIWATSKNVRQFRIQFGLTAAFLFVFGLIEFFALRN
jgi:hypothetical protein